VRFLQAVPASSSCHLCYFVFELYFKIIRRAVVAIRFVAAAMSKQTFCDRHHFAADAEQVTFSSLGRCGGPRGKRV
jgi:hypothetical protein